MNTQLTNDEYNFLSNAMRKRVGVALMSIDLDFAIQDLYIKKFFKELIIKCNQFDEEFLENIVRDNRVVDYIRKYNDRHPDEPCADFFAYILKYPDEWKCFLNSVCNDNRVYKWLPNEEYEWKFIIPNSDDIPTLDEFRVICSKEMNRIIGEKEMEKCAEGLRERFGTCTLEYKKEHMWTEKDWKKFVHVKGRKKNIPINKYDKEGNLIETYKDREECIEKNGLTKAGLSQHLSGKRKTLKGYIFKEEL